MSDTRMIAGHKYTDCPECGLPLGIPDARHLCSRKATIEWLCDVIEMLRIEVAAYHEMCHDECAICDAIRLADQIADVRFGDRGKTLRALILANPRTTP